MQELILTTVPAEMMTNTENIPSCPTKQVWGAHQQLKTLHLLGPRDLVTYSNLPRVDHRACISESEVKDQSKCEDNYDSGIVKRGTIQASSLSSASTFQSQGCIYLFYNEMI